MWRHLNSLKPPESQALNDAFTCSGKTELALSFALFLGQALACWKVPCAFVLFPFQLFYTSVSEKTFADTPITLLFSLLGISHFSPSTMNTSHHTHSKGEFDDFKGSFAQAKLFSALNIDIAVCDLKPLPRVPECWTSLLTSARSHLGSLKTVILTLWKSANATTKIDFHPSKFQFTKSSLFISFFLW